MKKNVAFIANYTKTVFFEKIADNLLQNDIGVFWFVVNEKQYLELCENYKPDNVLLINKTCLGKKIGEFKINEIIYGDRSLRHQPKWGKDYLLNIQEPIYNFIRDNEIGFVFGETTWSHEILIHRISSECKELNCQFLFPHTIRIPNGRFTFFKDEDASEIYEFDIDKRSTEPFEIKKPSYLKTNDLKVQKSRTIKKRINRLLNYLNNVIGSKRDKNDPTLIRNSRLLFIKRLKEEYNKEMYRFVRKTKIDHIKGKNYIYCTLHKQPEQSIDVIGRYNENQLQNIINLWRVIPDDWYVVVKEHTNAIGDRPYSFFKNLLSYDTILIADEKIDSNDLIKGAKFVSSVSGTSAYEAGLIGKESLLYGNTFFSKLFSKKIDTTYLNSIKNINDIKVNTDYTVEEFKEIIMGNSYPGEIGDPVHVPQAMNQENIEKVSNAFIGIINN